MRNTFSKRVQTLLLIAMFAVIYAGSAYAEVASSDEISAAVMLDGSIPVNWENDAVYPWTIEDGWMKSGNVGNKNTSSSLVFSYNSEYQTEVTFNWWNNQSNSSYHWVHYYVDGAYKGATTSSSQDQVRFYLPQGIHVVEVVDSIGNYADNNYYAGLKNVSVKEAAGLENVLLTEKSLPVKFQNDETFPWMPKDGYVQTTNYNESKSSSKLSATFTIDKQSKFSFERKLGRDSSNHYLRFYINGKLYNSNCNLTSWGYVSVVLEPGTYTVDWVDSNTSSYSEYYSQIRNIELHHNWVDVDVTPGTLGVEVLYKVDVLKDVELLKVNGAINSTDWATIKQMTNIHAINFEETQYDAVPADAFNGLSNLSTVKLPQGVKSIGADAFRNTDIYYITIPSSVTSIGNSAFYGTRLQYITFAPESELSSIGYRAFYQCTWLEEFIMPDAVTMLIRYNNQSDRDSYTFGECTSLKKVKLSNGLKVLPKYTFYQSSALSEVILPDSIETIEENCFYRNRKLGKIYFPETLRTIGNYAFQSCALDSVVLPLKLSSLGEYAFDNNTPLKYVKLPSNITNYKYTFSGCGNVQTIVCPAATPPSIANDPFSSSSKSTISLVVPSFAVVNYKLDSYWYQFGDITEGDEIDYWKISGELSLVNNRRMDGTPDVDLTYGGRLTVSGNAPMTIGNFNVFISENNPSRLLNSCSAFTAESITTHFSVSANTWYFLTPMADVDIKDIKVNNTTSFVFRYYDGANRATTGTGSSWKNVTDSKLKAGQGYIFQCNAASVVTFPVATELHEQILSTEAISIPLTSHASDNAANKGWNYVGNPYPCYYDIFYMDFTAPITVWTGSTYRAYSIADDNYVLRPMQGFFVQKPDAVDAIVLQTEGKQIASTINRASYASSRLKSVSSRHLFNVEIAADSICDMTRVVINDAASMAYEIECDATKFMSLDSDIAQIYTIDSDKNRLSINERPEDDGIVRLGVYVTSTTNAYTISASRSDGDIYLEDSKLNRIVNLSEEDYTFTCDEAGNIDDRFTLRLKAPITTGMEDLNESETHVKVESIVSGLEVFAPEGLGIRIFTIDGNICSQTVSSGDATRVDLAKGMYIVNVAGRSFKAIVR